MTAVKSSKPRSDASSCLMMFSCVRRPISGKSDKPDLFSRDSHVLVFFYLLT